MKGTAISMVSIMIIYSFGFSLFVLVEKNWWPPRFWSMNKKLHLTCWTEQHATHTRPVFVKPSRLTLDFCYHILMWWPRLFPDRQNISVISTLHLAITAIFTTIVFSPDWGQELIPSSWGASQGHIGSLPAYKNEHRSKQPSEQLENSEKLGNESERYNTDTVSPRTKKKQNYVKDKGRAFKRSLMELSLLCKHFVPGWAAEGIENTPT